MWALVKSGSVVTIYKSPQAINIGGIQHPRTIFQYWSAAQLKAIGIYSYSEVNANPDSRYYEQGSSNIVVDDSAGTVVNTFTNALKNLGDTTYTQSEIDAGQAPAGADTDTVKVTGLKTNKIKELKNITSSLLSTSDWYVIRKSDTSEAIPSAVATYRTAVRANNAIMESKVAAISDTTNTSNMNAFIALQTDTYHANGSLNTTADLNMWPTIPDILKD